MKKGFTAILLVMILAVAGIYYMVGRTSSPVEPTAQIVTVESDQGILRVLQYEGVNYIVGIVDSTGTQQLWQVEILGFLVSQANDRGIRRAIKAIGYEGPQRIEVEEKK